MDTARTKPNPLGRNRVILGDNLEALRILAVGEGFRADVIYIDPPYNVGGEQGYRNSWKGPSASGHGWAGEHGAFLDFMDPRLRAGRHVLAEDGVIFVSVCDGEYCRLKILMDGIFGEQNCLGTIIWNKVQGAYGRHLTVVHEYILAYAREASKARRLIKEKPAARRLIETANGLKDAGLSHPEAQKLFRKWIRESLDNGTIGESESHYSLLHPATFEPFQATSMSAQDKPETRSHEPLIHPVTGKPCKVPPMGWKWSEATMSERARYDKIHLGDGFVVAGEIRYGPDEATIPRQAFRLSQGMHHALPSVITVPHNAGKGDLPGGIEFATPKPIALIQELLRAFQKKDAVVLDFFAGSGSTGHAVHALNREDGGTRSWILIEEMSSTVQRVILPRVRHFDSTGDFEFYCVKKNRPRERRPDPEAIASN